MTRVKGGSSSQAPTTAVAAAVRAGMSANMTITTGNPAQQGNEGEQRHGGLLGPVARDYLDFKVRAYARPGDGSRGLLQGVPLHNSTIPHPPRKAVQVPKQRAHATARIPGSLPGKWAKNSSEQATATPNGLFLCRWIDGKNRPFVRRSHRGGSVFRRRLLPVVQAGPPEQGCSVG